MWETNLFNINDLTVLLVAFLSLALAVLLVARSRDDRAKNLLLAAFFLQITLQSIDILLYWNRDINAMASAVSSNFFFGLGVVFFLQGPLLYFAVRSVIYRDFQLGGRQLLHLLPALAYPFYLYAIYYRFDEAYKLQLVHDWSTVTGNGYFVGLIWAEKLTVFFYSMLCLHHLRRYIAHLKNTGSCIEKVDIAWLKLLVYGFAFLGGWHILILLLSFVTPTQVGYVMGTVENYLRCFLMAGLAASLLRNSIGFPAIRIEHAIGSTVSPDDQLEQHLQKLHTLMTTEKPYLQSNINVERLASRLEISPKLLSNVINQKLNQNFFEMIRHYRIEEARMRLVDDKLRNQGINTIMLGCGFNSKSVFNQSFKDKFGVTPSHYRKQYLGGPPSRVALHLQALKS